GRPRGERLHQRLQVRGARRSREVALREGEVETGLGEGPVARVGQPGLPNQQKRAGGQEAGGDAGDEDEGDREAPPEAPRRRQAVGHAPYPLSMRYPTPRTVVRMLGWAGSSSIRARSRCTATSTRRESPRYS